MAEYNEGCGEYSGGGESGTARTYTARTSDGRTFSSSDYNTAAQWAQDNRPDGGTAEVSTK